jgi:hypothetical protein
MKEESHSFKPWDCQNYRKQPVMLHTGCFFVAGTGKTASLKGGARMIYLIQIKSAVD